MLKSRVYGEIDCHLHVTAIRAHNVLIKDDNSVNVIITRHQSGVAQNGNARADRLGGIVCIGNGHLHAAVIIGLTLAYHGGQRAVNHRDGLYGDNGNSLGCRLGYTILGVGYRENFFTCVIGVVGNAYGKSTLNNLLSAVAVMCGDLDRIHVIGLVDPHSGVEAINGNAVKLRGRIGDLDRIRQLAVGYDKVDLATLYVGVNFVGVMGVSALKQHSGRLAVVIHGVHRHVTDVDLLACRNRKRNTRHHDGGDLTNLNGVGDRLIQIFHSDSLRARRVAVNGSLDSQLCQILCKGLAVGVGTVHLQAAYIKGLTLEYLADH